MSVLKEIFEKCTLFDGQYIALMPSNAANLLSHGYQVHMKVPFDDKTKTCMQEILQKYGLVLKEEKELAIIYRPKL